MLRQELDILCGEDSSDSDLEHIETILERVAQGRWTAWPVHELLVVCPGCGRMGHVTPEDADTWSKMKCQCGEYVPVPFAPHPRQRG